LDFSKPAGSNLNLTKKHKKTGGSKDQSLGGRSQPKPQTDGGKIWLCRPGFGNHDLSLLKRRFGVVVGWEAMKFQM